MRQTTGRNLVESMPTLADCSPDLFRHGRKLANIEQLRLISVHGSPAFARIQPSSVKFGARAAELGTKMATIWSGLGHIWPNPGRSWPIVTKFGRLLPNTVESALNLVAGPKLAERSQTSLESGQVLAISVDLGPGRSVQISQLLRDSSRLLWLTSPLPPSQEDYWSRPKAFRADPPIGHDDPRVMFFGLDELGGAPYRVLASFRAAVVYPYDVALAIFYELYSMGMPLFLPREDWPCRSDLALMRHADHEFKNRVANDNYNKYETSEQLCAIIRQPAWPVVQQAWFSNSQHVAR